MWCFEQVYLHLHNKIYPVLIFPVQYLNQMADLSTILDINAFYSGLLCLIYTDAFEDKFIPQYENVVGDENKGTQNFITETNSTSDLADERLTTKTLDESAKFVGTSVGGEHFPQVLYALRNH